MRVDIRNRYCVILFLGLAVLFQTDHQAHCSQPKIFYYVLLKVPDRRGEWIEVYKRTDGKVVRLKGVKCNDWEPPQPFTGVSMPDSTNPTSPTDLVISPDDRYLFAELVAQGYWKPKYEYSILKNGVLRFVRAECSCR